MKSGFYIKTAWNNIKKNYRFYIPQILTGTGLLACFYIVITLCADERIKTIPGGDYIPTFMAIGTAVIALLSVIIILYTNSFLMRQRKREYGLYNVLGLEKRHIGRILFCETAISGGFSLILGSAAGVLFYKICSLLICSLLKSDIIFGFDFITPKTILPAAAYFALIYLIAFIVNRITISRTDPVNLLKSSSQGEKEPKTKTAILVIGAVSLLSGYIISIFTKEPLAALLLFFAAVFLVILGTYFLFTSGSIFVLKALKRNKNYYYEKNRMPAVSGLLFRMKQNAVGLASICILATGVLIMISGTVSLYGGMQETLDKNYPQDLYLSCSVTENDGSVKSVPADTLEEICKTASEHSKVETESVEKQKYLEVSYLFDGSVFSSHRENYDLSKLSNVDFITESDYTALTGESIGLKENEIAVCVTARTVGKTKQPGNILTFHGESYNVKETLLSFPIDSSMAMISPSCYGVVVANENVMNKIFTRQKRDYGEYASEMTQRIAVKFKSRDAACASGQKINSEIFTRLDSVAGPGGKAKKSLQTYWDAKESVVGMYGTLLFLGIILGLVCLFATVLIIYYKQISEGYEDRERYQIMKKVGMSDSEVKRTIRSQTLFVFFLPLVSAGIHVAFAFPIVNRLLHLILLSSTGFFVLCSVITFALFALLYVLIYSLTAKTYYKIVH